MVGFYPVTLYWYKYDVPLPNPRIDSLWFASLPSSKHVSMCTISVKASCRPAPREEVGNVEPPPSDGRMFQSRGLMSRESRICSWAAGPPALGGGDLVMWHRTAALLPRTLPIDINPSIHSCGVCRVRL